MRCNTRNQQERGKSSDITNEKGKATVMDGIPLEVWKCLGEGGIDMLWDLMQMIYEQEKMPTEWRYSVIIPTVIFIKRRETYRIVEITGG